MQLGKDSIDQEDKGRGYGTPSHDWELDELESMKSLSLGSFP